MTASTRFGVIPPSHRRPEIRKVKSNRDSLRFHRGTVDGVCGETVRDISKTLRYPIESNPSTDTVSARCVVVCKKHPSITVDTCAPIMFSTPPAPIKKAVNTASPSFACETIGDMSLHRQRALASQSCKCKWCMLSAAQLAANCHNTHKAKQINLLTDSIDPRKRGYKDRGIWGPVFDKPTFA